jgi:hypothetical protein
MVLSGPTGSRDARGYLSGGSVASAVMRGGYFSCG